MSIRTERIKNVISLEYFMVSKLLGYSKKIHYIQDQTPSIKCAYRGRECILIEVRTHIYYLSPIENENLFEYPLIITKIFPFSIMFNHYENEIIQIRIRIPIFAKGGKTRLQGF